MITGELKHKIDSLWEMFWTGGLTNPLDVVEQMTYLMFIRDLDGNYHNKLRVELLQKLAAAGYSTPVFISDAASVSPSAVLEPGCIILPQAYVGADAHLGVGCIVNAGAIVDHNAHLGRGVHVAPGGIVKASAEVAEFGKVDSGEIVRSPWENQ